MIFDVARGIAAKIWCLPNNRRRVMDAQLCEDFANVLVDELTKVAGDTFDFAKSQVELANAKAKSQEFASLKDHYKSLNDQYERLKVEHANLQSTLKLVKPDEVV